MTRFIWLYIILLSGCTLSPSKVQDQPLAVASAAWIKIDDFENPEALRPWTLIDTQNETVPRVEHPQITQVQEEPEQGNHFLLKKPAAEGIIGNRKALSYIELPQIVGVGEVYTFYTRFKVEYFPNNHVFGLSNLGPEGINEQAYDAFEPSLRITDKRESDGTQNDGTLMVRKGAKYDKIWNPIAKRTARPLQTGTWYEVWYVVNNKPLAQEGQSYEVYLKGGEEFPQQQQVYTHADFRMKRELPLRYFLANCNTGPIDGPYGNGGLCYDDLYMIQGVVLAAPQTK